jgi:DNA-binding NtrC family response regulator
VQDKNSESQPKNTVFLVDDEPDITSVMKMILEQNGFVVHAFNDPKQSLEEFRVNGKDCTVVLSDIRMPRMNGFQLARQVSHLRPDVRIVLMTSFEIQKEEFEKMFPSIDIAAFLKKPVSQKKLIDTLNALFVDGR